TSTSTSAPTTWSSRSGGRRRGASTASPGPPTNFVPSGGSTTFPSSRSRRWCSGRSWAGKGVPDPPFPTQDWRGDDPRAGFVIGRRWYTSGVTGRIVIVDPRPRTPTGKYPAKGVIGQATTVSADVFRDGH